MEKQYKSFEEFYHFYLSEHSNIICRRLHFTGTALLLFILFYTLISTNWIFLISLPIVGYGFAWIGHFFYEKNKPATFRYPFFSLAGDFVMFKDILIGKVKI